jgi:hypothetical protein
MEMKAETSRVLMSEALKGRVTEEIEDESAVVDQNFVTVVLHVQVANKKTAIVGIMRSVLFESEPELDVRVQMSEALDIVSADALVILAFELHHDERVIKVPGPFKVKGARIDEHTPGTDLCLLSLGLKRAAQT